LWEGGTLWKSSGWFTPYYHVL